MSAFADIFDSTSAFLRSKGVALEVLKRKKATHSDVDLFRRQTGVSLPASFSAFFTDFADGFDLRWEKGENTFGAISIPSLQQLAEKRRNMARNVRDFLDDPNSLDRCVAPEFRAEAFHVLRTMESWVPFWDEGNGDHFCVDASSGRIVYDQHDWFDGFGSLTTTSGIVAGQNLSDFLENWSRFCFQPNKNLWWGEFGKFGAIKWEAVYFEAKFFRGSK